MSTHARKFAFPALPLLVALLAFGSAGVSPPVPASAQGEIQGDVNCDTNVNAVDSLQVLRRVAGLSTNAACLDAAGDVDCSGALNSVDALRILRHVAGLSNAPIEGCTAIGEPLAKPPTSEQLIEEALAAGEIDYEESLLYRAYALYDDPRLPDEFRSPVFNLHAAFDLFREVTENEATLSQQLLEQLAPFRARPADPISIFNNPPQAAGAAAPSSLPMWASMPAAGGMARVWVKQGPDAGAQLTPYANEVTRVWGQLPGLIRYGIPDTPGDPEINPDSAIDLYFAPVGEIDQRKDNCRLNPAGPGCAFAGQQGGYTDVEPPNAGRTWSAHIMIDAAVQGDLLTSHIAHELFHAGQFTYDAYESEWLMDSTATWGAFRVLQNLGVSRGPVFEYLSDFFKGLDKTLTRNTEEDLNRYASWLFFFFASMEKGDGIVEQIWQSAAVEGEQGPQAVDQKLPFNTYFDDFAVRNWNQKPPLMSAYKDSESTFPTHKPGGVVNTHFGSPDTEALGVGLDPLSAYYGTFTFADSVRTIVFDNKLADLENIHVWGMVKIGEDWEEPADWSDIQKKEFCRDDPEENVTELVLVVSNSNMTSSITPPEDALVEGKPEGCNGWRGTATMTATTNANYYRLVTNSAEILWEPHDDAAITYPCTLVPEGCIIYFPTGEIQWTYYWLQEIPGDPGFRCEESHAGTFTANNVIAYFDQVLELAPQPDGGYTYTGNGLDPVDRIDLECGGLASYPPVWYFHAPDTEDFQIPAGADSFSGSHTLIGGNEGDTTYEFEWEFHKVGNPFPPSE